MSKPLADITVLALEQAVAAPLCTRHLADLGARVIKIERPGSGDFARGYDARVRGLSSHFVLANRSKQSICLDLKHREAGEILARLLARTDVLVQNLAPGATARLGLSHAKLEAAHPRLVVCDISGYGDSGPYRDKKAYDLLVQSEAGFLSVTGTPEAPAKAGCSVADIAAGMYAYSGILTALLDRTRTGRGARIEVAMLDAMVEWMGYPLYYAYDGTPPPRSGAAHATIYPYGPFPVGDGTIVMLGVQNDREWLAFCEQVLGHPELAADPRYASNARRSDAREGLRALIVDVFAGLTSEQVVTRLEAAGIANARVNDMHDVWRHPQLAARGRWTSFESPAGPLRALRPPGLPEHVEPCLGPLPALGEHTEVILSELGFDSTEIRRLHEVGAI
jgi:itaconate CoA-transferase